MDMMDYQNSFLATSMTTTMHSISSFHNNTTNTNRLHVGRMDIPTPTLESILAPIKKIVRNEGIPLVNNAVQRREGRINQFIEMCKQDLEEKLADEAELSRLESSVTEMQEANAKKEATKAKLMNKLEELKAMPEIQKKAMKLEQKRTKKEKKEEGWRKIQKEIESYEEFQRRIGVRYLGLCPRQESLTLNTTADEEKDENRIYDVRVSCSKVHPQFPDDVYDIYFTEFHPTDKGIHFKIYKADPTFPEFESIASKYNESQNFRGFIDEVRAHWTTEANKDGQPRVGTPGNQSTAMSKITTPYLTPKTSQAVLRP